MSGWAILGIATAMSLGLFLNGLRFARMTKNPWAGRQMLGMPIRGADMPVERIRLIGRIQMIFAPIFLAVVAALAFGWIPDAGIKPIGSGS